MKITVTLLLIALCWPNLFAQASIEGDNNLRYCIGVKGRFISSSECNKGKKPAFKELSIKLMDGLVEKGEIKGVTISQLRSGVFFNHVLKGTGALGREFNLAINNGIDIKLHYDLHVTDILNDTHIYGDFFDNESKPNRLVGLNESQRFGASDPCSNWINFGDRESYDIFFDVIVDDPVHIGFANNAEGNNALRLPSESGQLIISVGSFYQNAKGSPVLQVAISDDTLEPKWIDLPHIRILPNSEIKLYFSQIAGKKNSTLYKELIGKNLKFRVKKTLMNNELSYGMGTGDARFDPPGPQFYISDVTRTACEVTDGRTQANIFVHLPDVTDAWYMEDSGEQFVWKYRLLVSGHLVSSGNCSMELYENTELNSGGLVYRLIPVTNGEIDDPFKEVTEESIFYLQLTSPDESEVFCTREFKVSGKPELINVSHEDATIQIGESSYHLLSMTNPYAILNIVDDYAYANLRKPYVITKNGIVVQQVPANVPPLFSQLSDAEKAQVMAEFDEEYQKLLCKQNRDCAFGRYFETRFKIWKSQRQTPYKYTGTYVQPTKVYLPPSGSNESNKHLASPNKRYLFFFDPQNLNNRERGVLTYPEDVKIELGWGSDLYHNYGLYSADNDGSLYHFISNTWTQIAFYNVKFSLVVYDCSSNVLITREPNRSSDSDPFYWTTIGSNGEIAKKKIADYGKNIMLSNNGQLCFFTSNDGFVLYMYDGVSVRAISNSLHISSIEGIDVANRLCIIKSNNVLYSMIYDFDHYYNDFITLNYFKEWEEQFRSNYWNKWIQNRFGYRLYGVTPNITEHYELIDKDNCSVPFEVEVRIPPQPNLDHVITQQPSSFCLNDGEAKIIYKGGGHPAYHFEGQVLENIGDEITVSGISYGVVKLVSLLNEHGEVVAEYRILLLKPGSVELEVNNVTCVVGDVSNGRVTIALNDFAVEENPLVIVKLMHFETRNEYKNESFFTEGLSISIDELTAGLYDVQVFIDGCCVFADTIQVLNRAFSVTCAPEHATTFGGTGKLKVDFSNKTGLVTWLGADNLPNNWGNGEVGVPQGNYSFVALHTDVYNQTCKFSLPEIVVSGPKVKASIDLLVEQDKDGAAVLLNGTITQLNGLANSNPMVRIYRDAAVLVQKSIEIENEIYGFEKQDLSLDGVYRFAFLCDNGEVDLATFTLPVPLVTYTLSSISANCPGDLYVLNFSGLGGGFSDGSYLLSNNNVNFSNKASWSFSESIGEVFIQNTVVEDTPVLDSEVTFSKVLVRKVSEAFTAPTPVNAGVLANNVTCYGKNDGIISIKDLEGGSGTYQWKYGNNNSWLNPSESAKNISPGSYDIYLKDSKNSCQEVNIGVAIITEPHLLKIDDVNVTDPICAVGLGAATIYVSGGNNVYRYKLMKGNDLVMEFPNESDEFSDLPHFTFQNLSAGDYTVSVSDVGECIIIDSFTVAQYQNPKIDSYTFADVSCNGLTDGYIEIKNVSGSDNVFQLFMSEGSSELEEVNLSADSKVESLTPGSYTMVLKDTKKCESEPLMVTIGQPEQLGLEVRAIVPEIVFGNGDGLIRARTVGGKLKGSMKIKTKSLLGEDESEMLPVRDVAAGHQFELAGLSGGLYEIEVTDSNGCVFTSERIEVPAPPSPLQIEIVSVKDALCNARLGSFQIKGSGGWGDYTYRLATHTGTTSISNYEELSAGSYKVFVQDKLGASVSTLIEISEPGKLEVKATDHIDPTCGNNGTLTLEVSGGAEPYKISIDNWLSSKILDLPGLVEFGGKAAGGYSVKVEDKNGCEALAITDLSASSLLKIDRFVTQSPSAEGAEDGQIAVIVSGGGAQLTYEWRNITQNGALLSLDQKEVSGIGSGYYEVLISQSEGCAVSDRIYLPSVSDGLLDIKELGHETRFEAADGYAVLVSSLENITSIEIYYPENRIDVLTDDDLPVEQGEISLVNLPSGSYLVKAFGENEVEISVFNIVPYEPFVFQNVDVNNVSKPGEDDGSVIVFITGGAPGFSYNWYDASGELLDVLFESFGNVAKAYGLTAGSYRVDVTDVYENTISYDFVVLQPDQELQITVSRFQNQSCEGFEDAWVQVGAAGGWSNYQYKHEASGTFQNYFRWNDLPVGEHTFFVIDQKGVESSVSITITQPDVLSAIIERIDGVQCFGESNGRVFFDINGGTAPYKYAMVSSQPLWQNKTEIFDTDDDEWILYFDDGLSAGTLLYQFTDANNCPFEGSLTVVVPQPNELSFSDTDVVHTTCNQDNGRVVVEVTGGTMPYRFQWSNATGTVVGSDFFVENLKQNGFYRLNVWDKHNCHLNTEFFINPSTLPVISGLETSPVLCYGDSNGSATVKEVTAAVPYAPYELHWSNNATGFSTDGLKAGRHFVKVKDTNQCETTKYFNIATPDTLGLSVLKLKDAHCYGYSDGEIEVLPFGGVGEYNIRWSNGDNGSVALNLSKGSYRLSYTDANNCLFGASFMIDEPPLETVTVGDDFTMCPGNSIEIDGQNFVAHQWTKDDKLLSTERYLTVSDEGYYNLRVTNAVGCFAYDTIRVSIGNDALKADFLMASQAFVGDTIMIFELSNLPLDHLTWEFSTHGFSDQTPVDAQNYILHLEALNEGMYNVVLNGFSGGCFSKKVKQVEVKSERLSDEEENPLGYKDPLIKSFVVSPNPNDGRFMVHIELKEESSIQLSVFSISRGVKLEERTRTGFNFYSETFTLANVNTGVYVVILNAGNERRQVKIIIE